MKLAFATLATVGALAMSAPAAAVTIIDVNGRTNASNNGSNAVAVNLAQGRYTFSFTQGAFTAHNRWGNVSGCLANGTSCTRGWETIARYYFGSNTAATQTLGAFGGPASGDPYYRTAAQALAASSIYIANVTIAAGGQTVRFYIPDGVINDNVGGVSIAIASVPEPATWAMMILGFGLVGGAMRARRRTTVKFA
jgi:hypothetical protein